MKIAITSTGEKLEAPLESRFGRARNFLLCDLEQNSFEVLSNLQNLNSAQGAGIQAAETVAHSGAACVITGHCGPKAFRVLRAAGIEVYNSEAENVAQALEAFKEGKLKPARSADVEGHWS